MMLHRCYYLSVLAAAGVAALMPLQAGSGASAQQQERYRNPIVFQRAHLDEASGKPQLMAKLWVMEEDGTRLRQITHGETYDDHPSFFSDQRTLLYSQYPANAEDREASPKLMKMDIDTGELVQLTRGGKKFVSHRARM